MTEPNDFADRADDAPEPTEWAQPQVDVNQPLHAVEEEVIEHIRGYNTRTPAVFVNNDSLVWVALVPPDDDEDRRPKFVPFTSVSLAVELSRVVEFGHFVQRGRAPNQEWVWQPKNPPDVTVRGLLANIQRYHQILRITSVVAAPVFAVDGSLNLDPGYDPGTKTWYAPVGETKIPPVVDTSPEAVHAAVALLREAVCDFPFADQEEGFAQFLSLVITFVTRKLFPLAPMFGVDAPVASTGKTLLADVAYVIVSGTEPPPMYAPRSTDEWDKRITSALRTGRSLLFFDNVEVLKKNPVLAALLTSTRNEGRELGVNNLLDQSARNIVFLYTGNNVIIDQELARRAIRIRLDAKRENPGEHGTGFKGYLHDPLLDWVRERRGDLLHAIYTVVRAWFENDRPAYEGRTKASYELWSRVVGGVLKHAGVEGFLKTDTPVTDPEVDDTIKFVESWYEVHRSDDVTAKELDTLAILHLGVKGWQGAAAALAKLDGRVFGNLRVVRGGAKAGVRGGGSTYHLEELS